jgi:hypothetical protein
VHDITGLQMLPADAERGEPHPTAAGAEGYCLPLLRPDTGTGSGCPVG